MTLFRRSTRPWACVRVLSQCGWRHPQSGQFRAGALGIKAGQFSCRSGSRWR